MSRIRTIKPEFWTSEQVADCSLGARLLFIGLWNFCDDNGVHPAQLKKLGAELFPMDKDVGPQQIGTWMDELIRADLVRPFKAGESGNNFWHVASFRRHQKIDRPTFKYPAPPQNSTMLPPSIDEDSSKTRRSVDEASASARRAPPPGMESNGVESKGKEEKCPAARRPAASPDDSLFDAFYRAYPRKDGKKAARKAWDKLKPSEETFGSIMSALKRQATSDEWKKDGGQYIPYPATWLNGERWADEGVLLAAAANTDYEQTQARLAREAERGKSIKADPQAIAAARATAQAARVRALGAPLGPRPIGSAFPVLDKAA